MTLSDGTGSRGALLRVRRSPTPRGGAGDAAYDAVSPRELLVVRSSARLDNIVMSRLCNAFEFRVFESIASVKIRGAPMPSFAASGMTTDGPLDVPPLPRRINLPAQLVTGDDRRKSSDRDDEADEGVCSD